MKEGERARITSDPSWHISRARLNEDGVPYKLDGVSEVARWVQEVMTQLSAQRMDSHRAQARTLERSNDSLDRHPPSRSHWGAPIFAHSAQASHHRPGPELTSTGFISPGVPQVPQSLAEATRLRPMDRYWWSSRVCVIADCDDWAAKAVELCHRLGARPEILAWSDAERLDGPMGALLVQRNRVGGDPGFEPFQAWSGRAWQPFCVMSYAPVRGTARLDAFLDGLGYIHVLHCDLSVEYWSDLQAVLAGVLDKRAWLVTWFAEMLNESDPNVVRALASLVLADDSIVTVRRWAQSQGMGYRELEILMSDHGMPSPKRLLDRIRIAIAVAHASIDGNASREKIARRLRYSSGDYLGRQAKRLTGHAFGALVRRGVESTISDLLRYEENAK